jgi:HipA-like protein
MQPSNYVFLIWKDPQSRRNFIIGKLSRDQKYQFEYFGDYEEAEKFGWDKFKVFPEDKVYESENLFPVFASRLPDKKRRDIEKILNKYELSEFDDFELLRKSGARLPIDTYYFVNPICSDNGLIQCEFFIMGIRHHALCKGENCARLFNMTVGEQLILEKEPDNQYDSDAIRILTQKGEFLGYVPRYYNSSVISYLDKNMKYSCEIVALNRNQDCNECIKVRLTIS